MLVGEMKKQKLFNNKRGVAGVIEALLLVGLVAVILSIVQLSYIPQVMNQREAEHMDEVANQFSFLKSVVDLQSMTKENVPISSPITLGSRELPYFVTARADGKISIVDYGDYKIDIDFGLEIPLTSIKYEAFNRYYLDGRPVVYSLEGGAVITEQYDGETIRVKPKITIENQTTDINIYYDIPIFVGIEGKKNTSGGCPPYNCFIRTNYSSSDANWISMTTVSSINITTDYPEAWYNYLNTSLEDNVNLEQGSYYVEITNNVKDINLYYKRTYIYAQVSPGWIT